MGSMAERPGVMLYFESVRPALNRLDDAQCGALFRAVMDYAEYGTVTELDAVTGIVFELLLPKIDRDAEKYEENREQRQYAAYSREAKRKGEQPMEIALWRLSRTTATGRHEPSRAVTDKALPSPSTSASPSISVSPSASISPSVSPSISASVSVSASASGEAAEEGSKGEGEGGPSAPSRNRFAPVDGRDGARVCEPGSRLSALGFDADLRTRELRRLGPAGFS